MAPDLRGHGLSDKSLEEYTQEVMASDTKNLLRTSGIEQASSVDHSMEVRIVLQFALDQPRLVKKIVLVSGQQDLLPNNILLYVMSYCLERTSRCLK